MENGQKKKISNFMWWIAFVIIIAWFINKSAITFIEVVILLGIWLYFAKLSRKSANTNGKEEAAKEHKEFLAEVDEIVKESNSTVGEEKTENFSQKSDSFYSGISEGSSIDEGKG